MANYASTRSVVVLVCRLLRDLGIILYALLSSSPHEAIELQGRISQVRWCVENENEVHGPIKYMELDYMVD